MPEGPWVVVVGAHRSGTSAITGALVAMGLQGVDPGDRTDWEESNPEHWESLSAALFDDELLAEVGGTWDAPPELGRMPDVHDVRRSPADIMAAAYPGPGPLVWKDPRACLLLSYWRHVLPAPLTAVFVWRDPMAVAQSLHARDGMSIEYGLALWERYNRSAAAGLQGVDTFVLDYDAAMADATTAFDSIATWLGDLDRFGPSDRRWDINAAAATIDQGLHHQTGRADSAESPSSDPLTLSRWLSTMAGGHRPFSSEPPPPVTPWPDALIALRREQIELRAELRTEVARTTALVASAEAMEQALRSGYQTALVASAEAMEQALRSGYQEEIDRLVEQLHESRQRAESLAWEVQKVTSSASWKVTGPLRAAAARVAKPHD